MIVEDSVPMKIMDRIAQLLLECDETELHKVVMVFRESLLEEDEKTCARRILSFFRSGMATLSDMVLMKNGAVQIQDTQVLKSQISAIRLWAMEQF